MKECNQCGKCCINYGGGGLDATDEEIELWEVFNPEIYRYVKNNEIWFDPDSGIKLTKCPFLALKPKTKPHEPNKYTCSIYFNRPEDCRLYPSLVSEMIRDECEMIEIVDIENQVKAQIALEKLK